MTYENRTDEGAFLPSTLDDFGLSPIQFRVYYRIKRRAGSGQCWESAPSMAKGCLMDVKSVRKSIRELAKMGLISIHTRKGKSPLITLNAASMWQPIPKNNPTQNPPYPKSTQVQNGKGVGCETDRVPYPKSTDEDISSKNKNEERKFKGEQKKSDTSKEYSDGTADARNIQTFPLGVPSPSPESETNGKDSNADQKDICSAQSVKKPKWSRSLDGLRGNSSRQYQQAMAEKAALTLFNNDQEEQSFYQWAKQNLGKEGERQADISISRLRNKVKATPRDKELLETFRKTTRGPQKAPQQTREARMASVAEKYRTDPSILKKDATTFHREYGVSIHNFKGYLFEVGVL